MMIESTKCSSPCCAQAPKVITGLLIGAGLAAALWLLFFRRDAQPDPLTEVDRRIDELDSSLSRLQDVFSQQNGR